VLLVQVSDINFCFIDIFLCLIIFLFLNEYPLGNSDLGLMVRRLQADMEIIKISCKAPARTLIVTTEAEWISDLRNNNNLSPSNSLDRDLCELKIQGWIANGLFTIPVKIGDDEKTVVQPYFSSFIAKFLNQEQVLVHEKSKISASINTTRATTLKLISQPDDAHSKVSFEGRKPDMIANPFGKCGSLTITMVGDWKGRYSDGDFVDQDIGQILDFLRVLMTYVQPFRLYVYGILSDGFRFQFFKCQRAGNGKLKYEQSLIYTGLEGYQIFIGLLCAPLEDIGFMEYVIEGVVLKECLGFGAQSIVFSGEYAQMQRVVKVYKHEAFCHVELKILKALSNVEHVPKLVVESPLETNHGNKVLLVTPVGRVVQPKRNGSLVHGAHISNLIEVLRIAHSRGIVHCDIKPDNIYTSEECGIILNDWGSACSPISTAINRYGTYGFYDKHRDPNNPISPSDDLVALVKSAYLMLFNLPAPHPQIDQNVDDFWKKLFREDTIWEEANDKCKTCDYTGLQDLFVKIK
jgi:hypothetical protein